MPARPTCLGSSRSQSSGESGPKRQGLGPPEGQSNGAAREGVRTKQPAGSVAVQGDQRTREQQDEGRSCSTPGVPAHTWVPQLPRTWHHAHSSGWPVLSPGPPGPCSTGTCGMALSPPPTALVTGGHLPCHIRHLVLQGDLGVICCPLCTLLASTSFPLHINMAHHLPSLDTLQEGCEALIRPSALAGSLHYAPSARGDLSSPETCPSRQTGVTQTRVSHTPLAFDLT